MTYEEKRELYIAFSQILADAGLNTATVKAMVKEEIQNKVQRCLEQVIKELDATTPDGNYIQTRINKMISNDYVTRKEIKEAVKEELKNKIIRVYFDEKVESEAIEEK